MSRERSSPGARARTNMCEKSYMFPSRFRRACNIIIIENDYYFALFFLFFFCSGFYQQVFIGFRSPVDFARSSGKVFIHIFIFCGTARSLMATSPPHLVVSPQRERWSKKREKRGEIIQTRNPQHIFVLLFPIHKLRNFSISSHLSAREKNR